MRGVLREKCTSLEERTRQADRVRGNANRLCHWLVEGSDWIVQCLREVYSLPLNKSIDRSKVIKLFSLFEVHMFETNIIRRVRQGLSFRLPEVKSGAYVHLAGAKPLDSIRCVIDFLEEKQEHTFDEAEVLDDIIAA